MLDDLAQVEFVSLAAKFSPEEIIPLRTTGKHSLYRLACRATHLFPQMVPISKPLQRAQKSYACSTAMAFPHCLYMSLRIAPSFWRIFNPAQNGGWPNQRYGTSSNRVQRLAD